MSLRQLKDVVKAITDPLTDEKVQEVTINNERVSIETESEVIVIQTKPKRTAD